MQIIVLSNYIFFFPQGLSSIPDEQEYAALKALEFDLTIAEGNAVFVRVIQGREPVHLLQLFKGRLMIFNGKGTDCDGKSFIKIIYKYFDTS